ncbi:hypothetical protein NEF87_000453 [Candidatus Lokiarchaeum ossiferum]|uniref:DUF1738 domain-containing protein n=1 Tax=Candidatus Lokiarchaeum ossiferum TaxID=2951803 RepID=A0ABY6HKY0_9ARCH|nr:hypothetical protein NEF87_000453 [Candidatus Lokiarchaeum sp. B-35]
MVHLHQTKDIQKQYKKITARMIDLITKSNLLPWKQSWLDMDQPLNWATLRPYRSINAMMLTFTRRVKNYSTPFWVGYKQLQKLRGRVEKGEKGTPILIPQVYGPIPKKFQHEETTGIYNFIVRHVFNLDQCAIPERYHPKLLVKENFNPIEKAEAIIAGYKDSPQIHLSLFGALYNPGSDIIRIQAKDGFRPVEEYYGTLFHEMVHSTAHPTRLKRSMKSFVHRESYSREELIAEFGACFLAGEAHILPVVQKNSASYLQNWVKYLRNHEDELLKAAIQGARASNYILGKGRRGRKKSHEIGDLTISSGSLSKIGVM